MAFTHWPSVALWSPGEHWRHGAVSKPGYVMDKDHAEKNPPTGFSSTAEEWKSPNMMEKAVRKTTTAKARNLTENVKFDQCCT